MKFIRTTRFKTTIWYASLFLALELMIGLLIYIYLYTSLNKRLENSLTRQAETIFNFVTESKIDLNDFRPDSTYSTPADVVYDLIYESVTFNSRNTFVQVYLKNKIVFKTDNLRGINMYFPFSKDQIKVMNFKNTNLSPQPIMGAFLKKDNYKIIVAYPIDSINETLNSLSEVYIIIAPVFFMISIAGGFFISAKSLSRIDRIIKKTEDITAQNLDEVIEGGEFHDEYGRLVRTINNMIARIKTSIDYMNQFSISASHELKTPLTILRGEIEVTLKSPKTSQEYKEVLQSNYEETIRLINIVEKLFFISKIDNALISLNKEKTELKGFLEDIAGEIYFLGKDKNIDVNVEVNEKINIEIDRELMKEAILNLADNAVKYGDSDQTIIIKSDADAQQIRISVINKGEGIPADSINKIFDRFYRVESSRNRKTGGAGLGLSVVKSIVTWHEGEVTVNSDPENETVFTIHLKRTETNQ